MVTLPLLVARCLFDPLRTQPGPYRRLRRSSVLAAAPQPLQSVALWLPKQADDARLAGLSEQAKRSYPRGQGSSPGEPLPRDQAASHPLPSPFGKDS
jgi:hypothetical protein